MSLTQYTRAPKNLCRRCGYDFATLTGFDEHRRAWSIASDQELKGWCLVPDTDMGYVSHNGYWYTPEGYEQALVVGDRLKKAREVRGATS